MKLAIFFPGIGYTNDKPLMYYSRKITRDLGYEELCVEYHDLPEKVRGDRKKLFEAANLAYDQAKEKLEECDFTKYEEIVLVGKSIGTYLATQIASEVIKPILKREDAAGVKVRLVLYTPVESTFSPVIRNAIAFIGTSDPWSELEGVKRLAKEQAVPLHLYSGGNHSLECGEPLKDIETLSEVMKLTEEFLKK